MSLLNHVQELNLQYYNCFKRKCLIFKEKHKKCNKYYCIPNFIFLKQFGLLVMIIENFLTWHYKTFVCILFSSVIELNKYIFTYFLHIMWLFKFSDEIAQRETGWRLNELRRSLKFWATSNKISASTVPTSFSSTGPSVRDVSQQKWTSKTSSLSK